MATRYWFSRSRTATGNGRQVRPLCWQGWAVLVAFVASMVSGGVAFLVLGLMDRILLGAATFFVLATAGAGQLLWAAVTKSVNQPV